MDPQRWKRVDDLLQAALVLPPHRRDDFLRQACAGDTALLQEVHSLLTSHRKAGDFLESPAINLAAQTITLFRPYRATSLLKRRFPGLCPGL